MGKVTASTVAVPDLDKFRADLKALANDGLTQAFTNANKAAADIIVVRARAKAQGQGKQAIAAARTLQATKAKLRSEVAVGGPKAPWAQGSEFGAERDKLRLRKSSGGRATIVRNESKRQVRKTIARIEAQTDRKTGDAITVTGRFRGYNQFKPWRGNGATAGYWLFPAIREAADEILEPYADEIMKISKQAFPD